jgi:hypothetical protein
VVEWNITSARWYIGATVRFAISSPGAATPQPFSAIAHLRFQGYATLAEGNEFMN